MSRRRRKAFGGVFYGYDAPLNERYRPTALPEGSNDHDHRCRCRWCRPDPDDVQDALEKLAGGTPGKKRWDDIIIARHRERGTFDVVDQAGIHTRYDVPFRLYMPTLSEIRLKAQGWYLSSSIDPRARVLADRHYSRQKPGSRRFVAPGRCIVLLTDTSDALWASLWQRYAKHAWPDAWVCSLFRNESARLSSHLITEAVAVTRFIWGEPPAQGFVTFVDSGQVNRRRDPGHCYRKAGWHEVGRTRSGLIVLQLLPYEMPLPHSPIYTLKNR